jgi:FixJ family two-component response regulator
MVMPDETEVANIAVIEDDTAVRDSIELLLQSVGYHTTGFPSADAFNSAVVAKRPNCLVVDVRLPGLSGLGLQMQLAKRGNSTPIIFVSGHGDIPMASQAMKAGAVDFLTKPFREQELLDAVSQAIERNRVRTVEEAREAMLRSLLSSLTGRELEVANYIAAGLLNKQIAAKMGVSEVTVKLHRSSVMAKMETRSVADLVRIIDRVCTSSVQTAANAPSFY